MSDLTRAYIVGAWLKAKDDLTLEVIENYGFEDERVIFTAIR